MAQKARPVEQRLEIRLDGRVIFLDTIHDVTVDTANGKVVVKAAVGAPPSAAEKPSRATKAKQAAVVPDKEEHAAEKPQEDAVVAEPDTATDE